MQDINKKRSKKLQSIILNFILVILCIINVVVNNELYKQVLTNNYNEIKTIDDFNSNISFKNINLKDAKLEHYLIQNKKEKINIYTSNLDDVNILVLLRENTILTDKTPVEIVDDNDIIKDVKEKLKDKNYYTKVLSNINYNSNRKIQLYKIYVILGLIFISVLSIFINMVGLFKLSNSYMYKTDNKF